MVVGVSGGRSKAWGLSLVGGLLLVACGGVTPGGACLADDDCPEGLACGPMETCEERRMIDGCRMTAKCQEFGYCLAHEGHCRASDASCRASLYCQMKGYCSAQKGGLGCMVASDADCAESDACKLGTKCRMHDGRCVLGQPEAPPEPDEVAEAAEGEAPAEAGEVAPAVAGEVAPPEGAEATPSE